MPDEDKALWLPNQNFFPNRHGYLPRYIIIHGTAGFTSAQEVAHFFSATSLGDNPVSTHYVLGLQGELVQCVRETDAAWGNGYVMPGHDPWWFPTLNPNLLTISIEHVKLSRDNSDELTELQKHASFRLVQRICQRHSIPTRQADEQGGITGHFSMDPVNRSFCPGPYPWDELFAYLALR
jgi:N-acetyl-anhydromuramyl-L-alanine amidase AmpD